MYCKNCGSFVEDGAAFCSVCGTKNPVPDMCGASAVPTAAPGQSADVPPYAAYPPPCPYPSEPAYGYYPFDPCYPPAPVMGEEEAASRSVKILVFGIIGLVLSCSFFLSMIGVVFSGIAKGQSTAFVEKGGHLSGKSRAGRIMAKIGLPIGIVLGVIATIVYLGVLSEG